jgi:hypothetical protein
MCMCPACCCAIIGAQHHHITRSTKHPLCSQLSSTKGTSTSTMQGFCTASCNTVCSAMHLGGQSPCHHMSYPTAPVQAYQEKPITLQLPKCLLFQLQPSPPQPPCMLRPPQQIHQYQFIMLPPQQGSRTKLQPLLASMAQSAYCS